MPEVDDDELEAELDALGDEIALDDDTSYLDEAVQAPSAPTTVPGADSIPARVCIISHYILFTKHTLCFSYVTFGKN